MPSDAGRRPCDLVGDLRRIAQNEPNLAQLGSTSTRKRCETNPIRGDIVWDGACGMGNEWQNVRNEPNPWIPDSRQTCGGTPPCGHRARGRLSKQTQLARANQAKRSHLPEAGRRGGVRLRRVGQGPRDGDVGQDARNEPNSRRGRVRRGLGDEGRLCETNPIWAAPAVGTAHHSSPLPFVQNEPNSRLRRVGEARGTGQGAKCAKRTQSFDCGLRIQGRPAAGRPPVAARSEAGCPNKPNWPDRIMRNEPNSRRRQAARGLGDERRLRKTNPISAAPAVGTARHSNTPLFHHCNPLPFVQNEPNGRRGRVGRGLGDEGRKCKTKPIARSGAPRRCQGAGRWNTQHSTIPSFHHSNRMPFVQNEANRPGVGIPRSACGRFFSDLKMSPRPAKLLTPLARYDIEDSGHVDTWCAQDETCVWTEGAVQLCDVEEGSLNALMGVREWLPRAVFAFGGLTRGRSERDARRRWQAGFTSAHLVK
jgi:hypothetical protein